MRQHNSVFNQLCQYLNTVGNRDFKTGELWTGVIDLSKSTTPQTVHLYLRLLRKNGFISRVSRGVYTMEYTIPEQLTVTDLESAIGYGRFAGYCEYITRKSEPFNIKEYQREQSRADQLNEIIEPQMNQGVEFKNVYEVDMKTGEVRTITVQKTDESYKRNFNMFEDEDVAEAFAEGIVPAVVQNDDELDSALNELQNDIADVLFAESQIDSNPEYVPSIKEGDFTEDEFEKLTQEAFELVEIEMEAETETEIDVPLEEDFIPGEAPMFVKVELKPGTSVYRVTKSGINLIEFESTHITEVRITVTEAGMEKLYFTKHGPNFKESELGVTVFTNLDKALHVIKCNA